MKFTIKEKTVSTVVVEYEDKTTAVIPIVKGFTKDQIRIRAAQWNEAATQYDSVDDVPVSVGEVLESSSAVEEDETATYKDARRHHYPSLTSQADALYWGRNGDDTPQQTIDAAIKLVKDTIPKTWTGKKSEIAALMD